MEKYEKKQHGRSFRRWPSVVLPCRFKQRKTETQKRAPFDCLTELKLLDLHKSHLLYYFKW